MKRLNFASFSVISMSALLILGLSSNSSANNQGFTFVAEHNKQAEQHPKRYFVKYFEGQESEVKELLQQYNIQLVEVLVGQNVLIVSGEQPEVAKLAAHESVEYTEQVPVRKLLSK